MSISDEQHWRAEEQAKLHAVQQESEERASRGVGSAPPMLEAVFESITDGLFILDADGKLLRMNHAARELLGIAEDISLESLHALPFDLLDEQGNPLPYEQSPGARLRRGERIQESRALDVQLQALDGRKKYLNVSGAPLRDGAGEIVGMVMVCRDVTRRRRWEQRTREAFNALLAMTQVLVEGTEEPLSHDNEEFEPPEPAAWGVAQRLAELTCSVLGCERLSITAIDPETAFLRPLAVVGLSPEEERQWWAEQQQQKSRLTDTEPALARRLEAGEVMLIDLTEPPWNAAPNPYRIRTMLIAPMTIQDQLVGLISLDYAGAEHHYTKQELALAGAAAKLAATVIERERLLRQREELRASESSLRTINQQMTDLIALAHDAIIVRTPTGVILSWNQGAEKLYGWTAKRAIGQAAHELLQTRFPTSRRAMEALLEQQGRWEGQLIHVRRGGEEVTVESRQVLVRDERGQITAALEINRDISDLERLTREQAEAYARELSLRATKERMDEFLGITSHELRTPLTTIKGNIQLAKLRLKHARRKMGQAAEPVGSVLGEVEALLDRAERQVNVQNRLIRDLLDISRIRAGRIELNLDPCDLAGIVREAVADQRGSAPARIIHIVMAEEETLPVIADAERISQVVSNYLTNALKYSPAHSPILVRLERQGTEARVAVCDEGPGLTPTEQQQIWERFYQVEGIKRQRGFSAGLGLGLYICKAIIEEHHGKIGVESTKGEGATFWFTLPLAGSQEWEAALWTGSSMV